MLFSPFSGNTSRKGDFARKMVAHGFAQNQLTTNMDAIFKRSQQP